jgi:cytochrome c oxidase subunit III
MVKNRARKAVALPQDARAMQGVWLFLIALGIFFFSSILLYVVYIALQIAPVSGIRPKAPVLPKSFVPSTLLLIGISGCLELALQAARRDRNSEVRRWTIAAMIMGMLFMVIQSEGMYRLIAATNQSVSSNNTAYSLTFVLALLHALHVIGGIFGLSSTVFQAFRDKYDHERCFGLRFCTLYWHFLDIVWVFLIIGFLAAGWLLS